MNCLTTIFSFGSIETPLCFFRKIFLVIKGNRGQLSIFMGITLILVMSMLAFIINVGLFVKAKINLQNSVDAAAFSGAAVQARQLTNIAYANWELRNTYKEWMFKYYILGQLGQMPYNLKETCISGKNVVDYRLPTPPISGFAPFDKYNVPSICIHNNSKTNICPMFALPGIPRFPAVAVAGIAEIHEAFVTKLVEEKGKDCSRRSKANFLTALTWAYGSGIGDMPEAPLVVTNRPGAWPEALELAMRIRNLEMIVNRPAVADIQRKTIGDLQMGAGREIGFNERPLKAFWSAYKNLGGGVYKDCISGEKVSGVDCGKVTDELAATFSLTELPPQSFDALQRGESVSSFLIPPGSTYPSGSGKVTDKQYLDLQLMPVNLATMFSTFVDTANNNVSLGGVVSEATCGVSKTALPVPGYILGYNKNPKVLTYYAVKGEGKFIGLFFPMLNSDGIKLTAYAAAKPFGGRIGPKLFSFKDEVEVKARADINTRSSSYVSGLDISALDNEFKPGMPIPPGRDFWINNINTTVGGVPGTGSPVFFGIPNMIYDFDDESDLFTQRSSSGSTVQVINASGSMINFGGNPASSCPSSALGGPTLGLYHSPQLKALKKSLPNPTPGTTMSGDDVLRSIIRARRATKYDAINYLVPDFRTLPENNNALPMVQKLQDVLNVGTTYALFAPLVGPNLLYKTNNAVGTVIGQYMEMNKDAINTFLKALLNVGNSIAATPGQSASSFIEAAKTIHINSGLPAGTNENPALLPAVPETDPGCHLDMASKFNHFFKASYTGCGIVPLQKMMVDYIDAHSRNEGGVDRGLYYIAYYYNEPTNPARLSLDPDKLMTAYYPSPRLGVSADNKAMSEHPLKLNLGSNDTYSSKRNFYSTKFFQMAKIIDSPPMQTSSTAGRRDYLQEPALREGLTKAPDDLVGENPEIINHLKYDVSTGINNQYYLDF